MGDINLKLHKLDEGWDSIGGIHTYIYEQEEEDLEGSFGEMLSPGYENAKFNQNVMCYTNPVSFSSSVPDASLFSSNNSNNGFRSHECDGFHSAICGHVSPTAGGTTYAN